MSETLQSLADRQAITEMIYRYCRSVDRLDIPLGHSIWHEDAIADYGPDEIRLMRRCQVMATKVFDPEFLRPARTLQAA